VKKKSLINYKLFQNRKRFNPLSLFKNKQDLTYKEFVEFLESKMVDTPGVEYFERVKKEFLKITNDIKEKVEEVKQEVVEDKEEIKKIETSRQKRKVRRTKKNEQKEGVESESKSQEKPSEQQESINEENSSK